MNKPSLIQATWENINSPWLNFHKAFIGDAHFERTAVPGREPRHKQLFSPTFYTNEPFLLLAKSLLSSLLKLKEKNTNNSREIL